MAQLRCPCGFLKVGSCESGELSIVKARPYPYPSPSPYYSPLKRGSVPSCLSIHVIEITLNNLTILLSSYNYIYRVNTEINSQHSRPAFASVKTM